MVRLYFSPYYLCFRKHTKILATQKRFLIHTQTQKFTLRIKNIIFLADDIRFYNTILIFIFGTTKLFLKSK
jgi:hypothetical protein